MAMKVMKFGGSSLKDGNLMRTAATIVQEENKKTQVALVLSAMKGVTDLLIEAADAAERGAHEYRSILGSITATHEDTIQDLMPGQIGESIQRAIRAMLTELEEVLHGVELVKECSKRSLDLIVSFGERLCCTIFSGYLRSLGIDAEMIDAREIIRTDRSYGRASVDYKTTYALVERKLSVFDGIPVITGFIASSKEGSTTTLGRNGSDFTASIIGAALGAQVIEIWTDVDGVMSANPRMVPQAYVLPEITVQEAMELSYFGAEVIHPNTIIPAVDRDIPIRIKNTLNSSAPGTVISKTANTQERPITGIASIEDVALINIEGGGMIGVPGIASRVFTALAETGINVVMISQASSEHSICIVCRQTEAEEALTALRNALARELEQKIIQRFELVQNLEIIAVIGESMRGRPGISGKIFSSLGDASINVLAIAQGSSERNISLVIDKKDTKKALEAIHQTFLA